ncbi:MAG: acetolactate decarboxylase [Desulfovibrio sp.]|nr:acetolactate decarboxylase [Desulfovibrio sp.]|tara:strand:+ start:37362 stop:38156 length:795 start_codon:yes stop_codon:yes gene_type:complete
MFSKSRTIVLVLVLFLSLPSGFAAAGQTLYQYSTIDALLAGLYDGDLTVAELKERGGFGLGTLNGIDGELIVLDGEAYQAAAGGAVTVPAGDALVPFATVVHFDAEQQRHLKDIHTLDGLNDAIHALLPSENRFYAVRIDGTFHSVKTRAIAKQSPPYKPLAEVVKEQVVTTFDGRGTLIGLYAPVFVKGVNVPGFHWHYLAADRQGGGHVLDCTFDVAVAKLDVLRSFTVELPADRAFDDIDLSGDKGKELHAVEKDPAQGKR